MTSIRNARARALLAVATLLCASLSARADVIMEWNTKADEIAAQKQTPPVPHGRGLAMMHVAMFEAVNAIDHRYAPYRLTLAADRTASKEAAAATAGHDVLAAVHPDRKAELAAELAAMLARVPDGDAKSKGIDLGRSAAAGILALRANDGSAAPESYRPQTAPGVY